jgi:hypothetical protein
MPKLVNYAARFEFLREACFTLIAESGVHALSRPRVAAVLGASVSTVRRVLDADASLGLLAGDEVARRRRLVSFARSRRGREPAATLFDLLPEDDQVPTELVALRLRVEARPAVVWAVRSTWSDDTDETLAHRFQIAEHGYVARATKAPQPSHDEQLTTRVRAWDHEVDCMLTQALDELDVGAQDRQVEHVLVRAVVDGLTMARCLSGLDDDLARRALRLHVDRMRVIGTLHQAG